jgi:hypothetical protein
MVNASREGVKIAHTVILAGYVEAISTASRQWVHTANRAAVSISMHALESRRYVTHQEEVPAILFQTAL